MVAISDPVRAAEAEQKRLDGGDDASAETPQERAERLRQSVSNRLSAAADDATALVALAASDGAVVGGAFGSADEYASLEKSMRQLQLLMLSNPPATETAPSDDADDSAADEEA